MSHEPPRFPMPEAKANPTHVPAKGRADDDDTDEEEGWVLVRAIRKALGLTGQHDAKEAGTWYLLRFAVLVGLAGFAYIWTHSMWGWGPCPHRQHIVLLREFKPELFAPPQPAPKGKAP